MLSDSSRYVRLIPDVVEIAKDEKNHIGVAIGGGSPYCPCLYVVQVFDDGPVAKDGRIHAGDELVAVNGTSVKGADKSQVAKMIKEQPGPLKLSVNRLQFDDEAGQTLDITLKRLKHWWVEQMDAKTADAFGLSRAILCNDMLAKLLRRLEANQALYANLTRHAAAISRQHYQLSESMNMIASLFAEVAAREKEQNERSKFFEDVSKCHRSFVKETPSLVSKIEQIASTFRVYYEKAVPDTKDSVKKYLDKKFEYLSFCLKIKEMDDEEAQMAEYNDFLPRIDSGNYEYRIMLRSREKSRESFIEMRKHVMIKIEILDEKHVRELGLHLRSTIESLQVFHESCFKIIEEFRKEHPEDEVVTSHSNHSTAGFVFDDQAAPLIAADD
ncbi:PRKCA-binding protein [Aphelenchoides besseyi]|nr:PRKCA-binding protein [Aphelenchoides besseyi]